MKNRGFEVVVLMPYIFGFLGIMSLINHTYPLWASISLIILMAVAFIYNIIMLVNKLRSRRNIRIV